MIKCEDCDRELIALVSICVCEMSDEELAECLRFAKIAEMRKRIAEIEDEQQKRAEHRHERALTAHYGGEGPTTLQEQMADAQLLK